MSGPEKNQVTWSKEPIYCVLVTDAYAVKLRDFVPWHENMSLKRDLRCTDRCNYTYKERSGKRSSRFG